MISKKNSFAHFVDSVKGKDHLDIVYLAELEATEAWRQSKIEDCQRSIDIQNNLSYQSKLLALIDYMRHGLQSRDFDQQDRQLLQKLVS